MHNRVFRWRGMSWLGGVVTEQISLSYLKSTNGNACLWRNAISIEIHFLVASFGFSIRSNSGKNFNTADSHFQFLHFSIRYQLRSKRNDFYLVVGGIICSVLGLFCFCCCLLLLNFSSIASYVPLLFFGLYNLASLFGSYEIGRNKSMVWSLSASERD